MKRRFAITLLYILLFQTLSAQEETRAVWVATIGGIDWPHNYARDTQTIDRQKRDFTNMLDRLKQININTILLQTRVRGTVIYPSTYEPWDGCMSGVPGKSPGYDPLRFAIEECHKRGMELHAWVVTIPVGKWNALGCKQLRQKYPRLIQKIGPDGYMNPEATQIADYLSDICAELTKNYNIDGIHLDYIRYPEEWKMKTDRSSGRRYITDIVRKIHNKVKAINPKVKMSCSPLGKYKDLQRYSSRGWNAYQTVCQDAQAWLRDGLMDQLYPMMYFQGNNFYPFAADWSENSYDKDIAIGLGIYFLDPREGKWHIDEVKRQLNVIRSLGLGQCFFRAKFLLDNIQGLYDYLRVFNYPTCWNSQQQEKSEKSSDYHPAQMLQCDGNILTLPEKSATLDAEFVMVETLQGSTIATLPYRGTSVDVRRIPEGMYIIRSLGKKGSPHRLGFIQVKRNPLLK